MPDCQRRASRLPLSCAAVSDRPASPRFAPSAWIACALLATALALLLPARVARAQAQAPAAAPAPAPAPADDLGFQLRGVPLVAPKEAWDAPEPWRTDRFYFQFAYYTWHFHPDPDHQQSYLFDMEYRFDRYWLEGQWIAGLSLFQNSFGQFSQYAYGALQWRPWKEVPKAYVKVSAGLLHGYSGEYRDKIPFNHYEIAPAIIPSIGYCRDRFCGEFVLLGANAALFTIGMTVP